VTRLLERALWRGFNLALDTLERIGTGRWPRR
jgi:hypothetical protein